MRLRRVGIESVRGMSVLFVDWVGSSSELKWASFSNPLDPNSTKCRGPNHRVQVLTGSGRQGENVSGLRVVFLVVYEASTIDSQRISSAQSSEIIRSLSA